MMAAAPAARTSSHRERNFVLALASVTALCIIAVALFGPMRDDSDPSPTTYNSGSRGVKAAYLAAGELGYQSQRWDRDPRELSQLDAPSTTLVVTDPYLPVRSLKQVQAEIADFLYRGGRVLATGQSGAQLLPGGDAEPTQRIYQTLCVTNPEGPGPLASAGKVNLAAHVHWTATGGVFHVEHFCGDDAVVVRFKHGAGEAIWWSAPTPLTNSNLRDESSLKLALASFGPPMDGTKPRTILFDEYLHQQREGIGTTVAGLPWWPLGLQITAIGALLILSFGRRNGPVRMPVHLPRTSPLEFADSMGRLYQTAKATEAPLAAARAQMLRFLAENCGLSHETLRQSPAVIAESLSSRIGGDWTALADHLAAAGGAEHNPLTSKLALKIVQALEQDEIALAWQISASRQTQ